MNVFKKINKLTAIYKDLQKDKKISLQQKYSHEMLDLIRKIVISVVMVPLSDKCRVQGLIWHFFFTGAYVVTYFVTLQQFSQSERET